MGYTTVYLHISSYFHFSESIRQKKNQRNNIRRIPPYPDLQYTTPCIHIYDHESLTYAVWKYLSLHFSHFLINFKLLCYNINT